MNKKELDKAEFWKRIAEALSSDDVDIKSVLDKNIKMKIVSHIEVLTVLDKINNTKTIQTSTRLPYSQWYKLKVIAQENGHGDDTRKAMCHIFDKGFFELKK